MGFRRLSLYGSPVCDLTQVLRPWGLKSLGHSSPLFTCRDGPCRLGPFLQRRVRRHLLGDGVQGVWATLETFASWFTSNVGHILFPDFLKATPKLSSHYHETAFVHVSSHIFACCRGHGPHPSAQRPQPRRERYATSVQATVLAQ